MIEDVLANGAPAPESDQATLFEDYTNHGGYETLKKITSGDMTVDDVINTLGETALRGLGGAGFPTD